MNNEIRNELLLLLNYVKAENKKDKDFQLEWLLERFKADIERQLEDLEYKQNELKNNLELVYYVKKEIEKVGV